MGKKKISQFPSDTPISGDKFLIEKADGTYKNVDFDDLGSGGSQDLQSVTDIGATTTNLIEVGGLDNTAKLITLNKGGASSTGSGIQIEESGSILGYIKTAVGSAFDFLHPLNVNYARIALNLLTGNRTYNLPDNSGTIALTSDIPSSYKKIILNTTTSGTTSGTSITLLKSGLIPANTVQVGSKLRMIAKFYKTGSLGQGRTRFYINTSNTLTGATLLATQGLSTGNFFALTRTPEVKSATNTEFPLTTLSFSGDEGGVVAMASMSSINIDWTVDQYIMAAGECANAGDSMTCQSLEVLYL